MQKIKVDKKLIKEFKTCLEISFTAKYSAEHRKKTLLKIA